MSNQDNPQGAQGDQRRIQIQLDEATAKGIYANLVMVSHTENEFVFDYIFLQPSQPTARVQSRVILGPRQAKRLASILQDSVKRYEDRFGRIPASEEPAA
jgi:hypothetical protein